MITSPFHTHYPSCSLVSNSQSNVINLRRPAPIQVEGLSVSYRHVQALSNISCTLQPGKVTGIIGPNGAGKSTLMKAMLGLVTPTQGKVKLGDQVLSEARSRVAYVPQRSQIDWNYPATVWDVVLMGRVKQRGWFRRFSASSRYIATEALEKVGMNGYRDRGIGELSGGQQQRVFLARALAQQTDIFFLDEPFVGVDQKTEKIIFEIFAELAEAGKTVVVVNHDLGASITHFDNLVLLNTELVAAGSRQEVLTEANLDRAYGGKVVFFSDAA
jgi:manganese/iron transport system ATP-binding protein